MKRVRSVSLVLVPILGLSSLVAAQSQPSEFLYMTTVTVKPSAVGEYEDYVKKIIAGANKIGAAEIILGFNLTLGGPGNTYVFALPFNKWGEVDGWIGPTQILVKAYGEVEAAKIMKAGRTAVEKSESSAYRLQADLSTKLRAFDPSLHSLINYVRTEVEPEMASAYELYLAKLKAAQEQAPNAPTSIRRVSVHGTSSVYVSAQLYSKNSERDNWPNPGELLRKTYGEAEGHHLIETSARCIRNREIWVLAYRPDLSRPTAAKATTDN